MTASTAFRTVAPRLEVLPEPSPQPLVITLAVGTGEAAVVLSTDPRPDEAGVTWVLSDVQGWHTTPPTEPVVTALGMSDVSVAAARFPKGPREITVHGHALTGAFDTAEAARNRLYRAFDGYAADLAITVTEAIPKRVTARTAGPIEALPLGPTHFTFAVPLILPDPFKYGLDRKGDSTDAQAPGELAAVFPLTFPLAFANSGGGTGRITITTSGSAPTFPRSHITGPLSEGWRITNETSGQTLSFATAVGPGQTLTIDHAARTAAIDGYSVATLASGSWWPLLPGGNSLRFLVPTYDPAAQWTATFYDAYL